MVCASPRNVVAPVADLSDRSWSAAEIWDPDTERWTLVQARHAVPRTYHSTAVLLQDGRILHGGGGLCGDTSSGRCDANHLDAKIFSPPYLFNSDGTMAPRPTISLNTRVIDLGKLLTVTSSEALSMISMIRYSSATHSTNTDQRRIELCGPNIRPCTASPADVRLPANAGVLIRGHWMVYGINSAGVPSVGANILVK